MASRGKHGTLFHLLFPIVLVLSFVLFFLVPLIAVRYVEPSALADLIKSYLDWSVLIVVPATLISYHKARLRMLRPYLKQVDELASECRMGS
jgi:hypothetical protein